MGVAVFHKPSFTLSHPAFVRPLLDATPGKSIDDCPPPPVSNAVDPLDPPLTKHRRLGLDGGTSIAWQTLSGILQRPGTVSFARLPLMLAPPSSTIEQPFALPNALPTQQYVPPDSRGGQIGARAVRCHRFLPAQCACRRQTSSRSRARSRSGAVCRCCRTESVRGPAKLSLPSAACAGPGAGVPMRGAACASATAKTF